MRASSFVAAGVEAALVAYAQAYDDHRTGDVVGMYCSGGVFAVPGAGIHVEGEQALRDFYSEVAMAAPQRHLVFNTVIESWDDNEAKAATDLVIVQKADAEWGIVYVGRYLDTLHRDGDVWRFHRRTLESAD
jgi:hypothetical protein